MYLDGHERPDVVASRRIFCSKMVELLQNPNNVFIAQDESIFHAKDGITFTWHENDVSLKKKGLGKGIMKSCWMDHTGIVKLTDDEWKEAKRQHPELPQSASFTLKFGHEWGYYDYQKFEKDLTVALKIAKLKYPGRHIVMLFDHSSVHHKMAADALNVKVMNKKPGGKQPILRNTIYENKVQTFAFGQDHPDPNLRGVAKGIHVILQERGFQMKGKKLPELCELLAVCDDFKNEKTMIEKKCEEEGITCLFFPKFHCEFNWCELVWANSKRFCRQRCSDNLPTLEKNIPLSFAAIPPQHYLLIYQHALEEIKTAHQQQNPKEAHKRYRSHRPPVGAHPHLHLLLNYTETQPNNSE